MIPSRAAPHQSAGYTALAFVGVLALAAPLPGCAPAAAGSPESGGIAGARLAAAVLLGGDVASYPTLLEALRVRIPSTRVVDRPTCPAIVLRGSRLPGPLSSPVVYVDGTRTTGTCALGDIAPRDVASVEVYPQGVTTRPGYARSSTGLILVFLKRGDEPPYR